MAQNSWRISVIGILSTVALAACSPDEQAATTPAPTAPAQETPASDPALGGVPPVETPVQPAPEAQPQPVNRAVLSWDAPTQYSDGSALPDEQLAGFRIYHGDSEATLARIAEVDGHAHSMTIEDLTIGTHYFAVTAITVSGVESSFSTIGSKRVM